MSDAVLIALITSVCSILLSCLNLVGIIYMNRNVNRTHDAVNSKMSQLLALTASASRAEGKLEGEQR